MLTPAAIVRISDALLQLWKLAAPASDFRIQVQACGQLQCILPQRFEKKFAFVCLPKENPSQFLLILYCID